MRAQLTLQLAQELSRLIHRQIRGSHSLFATLHRVVQRSEVSGRGQVALLLQSFRHVRVLALLLFVLEDEVDVVEGDILRGLSGLYEHEGL